MSDSANRILEPLWHYDGQSAIRRRPAMLVDGSAFWLEDEGLRHGPYRFEDLIFVSERDGHGTYGLEGREGWRLGLELGALPPEVAAQLPAAHRYGSWIDRLGLLRASALLVVISGAVLAAILTAPQWIAPIVPESWERQWGNAMVGDLGGRICETPEGNAALAKLVAKLDDRPETLRVRVANIDMVNAVALPGGNIILFDGLLVNASGPEQVAGVLGHEIGHVRERHVMQALIRQMGLSLVMGGLDGNAGAAFNALAQSSYSKAAESAADDHAIEALRDGDISPRPTADLFRKFAEAEEKLAGGKPFEYLASHPASAGRSRKFLAGAGREGSYPPALSEKEWLALQDICHDDPDVKSEKGLFF